MDKTRISKLLKKVSTLLEDDDLSGLERDLAKKYLLELYEFVDLGTSLNDSPPVAIRDNIEEVVAKPKPKREEVSHSESIKKSQQLPSFDEVPTSTSSPSAMDPASDRQSDPFPQTPLRIQREVEQVMTHKETIPSKYSVLFERSDQNELSDKLSLSPIDDLRRALGINDKLLVVNELFGGDQNEFQETVDRLNNKYSFSEAKSYLLRYVIDKFEWLDEQKQVPARDFIKLVERRFLNSQ